MRHRVRKRPEGHLQCLDCRAAFLTEETARLSSAPCLGFKLPHGHPYDREHVLYPTYYDRGTGHGPDRLCDDSGCFCTRHKCDCDMCQDRLTVPALKILMDSQESDVKGRNEMTNGGIEMHLPATLRKHVIRRLVPETSGQHDLITACKDLQLGNAAHTVTVQVSMEALGAALDICRDWRDSENGNEIMASKSVLNRHELEYEPEDPRERRHEFKMPKSLAGSVPGQFWSVKDPEILADLKGCSWTASGGSGRVRHATLGWLLGIAKTHSIHGAGAPQTAGKKFIAKYTEAYEQTGRLINGYTGTDPDEDQDQADESAPVRLDWRSGELRSVPGDLRGNPRIIYGGKAGKSLVAPTYKTPAYIEYVGDGRYEIRALDGYALLETMALQSQLWWAPLVEDQAPAEIPAVVPAVEVEDQEPEQDQPEPQAKPRGPVPENFLYMAENANTPAARAWWAAKVESWNR